MDRKLIVAIATLVLDTLVGRGRWQLFSSGRKPEIANPLRGLSVGDTVYGYNSDSLAIGSATVVFCHNGVGYIACSPPNEDPTLVPICNDYYFRSVAECVNARRDAIQHDIDYAEREMSCARTMKKLIHDFSQF